MSRKRRAKKERKKQSQLQDEVGQLYRCRAWSKLVAVAHHRVSNPAASEIAGPYLEALDHLLLALLQQGKLGETAEVVRQVSGRAGDRPLVTLARAAGALCGGDTAVAASLLEDVATNPASGTGTTPDLSQVVGQLLALCQPPPAVAGGRIREPAAAVADSKRLLRGLERLYSARSSGAPAAAIGLTTGVAEAVWSLARIVESVAARGYRLAGRQRSALKNAAALLRQSCAGSGAETEATTASALAGLLVTLAEDLSALRPRAPVFRFQQLQQRLSAGRYRELLRLLTEPFDSRLLRHLQHTVRIAWHDLVELATGGDGERLAELRARQQLPDGMVRLDARCNPGAVMASRKKALRFAAEEDWLSLLALLGDQVATEPDAGRLAMLWATCMSLCHLISGDELADLPDPDELGLDQDDFTHDFFFGTLPPRRELEQRIPAEQRAGVARFVRDELQQGLTVLSICSHFGQAAADLLSFLPGDLSLLTIALAAALGGDSPGSQEQVARLRRHIADLGRVAVVDTEAVNGVIRELLNDLGLKATTKVLEQIRPLLDDETWRQVTSPSSMHAVQEVLFAISHLGLDREQLEHHLDLAERFWGGPEVAAARVVVECCLGTSSRRIDASIEHYCRTHTGLRAPLLLFGMLDRVTGFLPGTSRERKAVRTLAAWIVDHLEPDRRLLLPALPALVQETKDPARLRRILELLMEMIGEPGLPGEVLHQIRLAVAEVRSKLASTERRAAKPSRTQAARQKQRRQPKHKTPAKKRRQPVAGEQDADVQMAFDFSWSDEP